MCWNGKLERSDCLLLYSDGLTEAENAAGEEFGKERMKEVFRKAAPLGAQATVEELKGQLARFVDGNRQGDDVTMIVIERR